MATSYANPGASGDRRYSIVVTATQVFSGGFPGDLVNGSSSVAFFSGGTSVAGLFIQFDIGASKIIDEAQWAQDNATTQGIWKWQGSNDAIAWTDIGIGFLLGGSTLQTQTELNGNVTAYRYYRLLGILGTSSSSPFLNGINFKMDVPAAQDYNNTFGFGNRTANIVTSCDNGLVQGGISNTAMSEWIDGSDGNNLFFHSVALAGTDFMEFDFSPATTIIDEVRLFQQRSAPNDQGTWQMQGWNGATWVNLGAPFAFTASGDYCATFTGPSANVTAYTKYQFVGSSGNTTSHPFVFEFVFRTNAGAPPPTATARLTALQAEYTSLPESGSSAARYSSLQVESFASAPTTARLTALQIEWFGAPIPPPPPIVPSPGIPITPGAGGGGTIGGKNNGAYPVVLPDPRICCGWLGQQQKCVFYPTGERFQLLRYKAAIYDRGR